MEKPFLDLKEYLRKSESRFLRNLPGFLISIMKWVIVEKKINSCYTVIKAHYKTDFAQAIVDYLNVKVIMHYPPGLEQTKRCILVANHPFGAVDSLIFMSSVKKIFQSEYKIIANEMLLHIPNLKPCVAPVNVFKRNSKETIQLINQMYAGDEHVLSFPAAEVSRVFNGKVCDGKWTKSFVQKAIDFQRPIVPVLIDGYNSRFFYGVYKFRKLLRIGANLELLLLPRELFNKKNRTVNIYFGNPILPETMDTAKHNELKWAEIIREKVYSLKNS